MKTLPAYILAGGRSRRFGSDKAMALVYGKPLLIHVATMLGSVATDMTVVADRADKYADLGFRTIADRQPGFGPLAGLDTALHDLPGGSDWLLLCSCDAVVVRRHWLEQLVAACDTQHDAVAFRAERWQPMPALYTRSAQPTVSTLLCGDNRSMQRLLNQLAVKAVPLPSDWPATWQINTPDDLDRHLAGDSS